jgi:hypothetical protein
MQNMIRERAARLRSDGCLPFKTTGRIFASLDGSVGDIAIVSVEVVALRFPSTTSANRRTSARNLGLLAGHTSSENSDRVGLGVEVIGYLPFPSSGGSSTFQVCRCG